MSYVFGVSCFLDVLVVSCICFIGFYVDVSGVF